MSSGVFGGSGGMVLVRVGAVFLQVHAERSPRCPACALLYLRAWKVTDGVAARCSTHARSRAAQESFGRLSGGWGTSVRS